MIIFLVTFALIWLGSTWLDYIKWKQQEVKNVSKGMYVSFQIVILAMYTAYAANIRIPMPTQVFVQYVAPWVRSALRGMFHA